MTSSTYRQDWSRLVEEVASMNSLEPLPKTYAPQDFLPGGVAQLPSALVTHLRQEDGDFEATAAKLFQPQISLAEGFHAQPTVPRFSSRVLQADTSETASRRSEGGANGVPSRNITGALPRPEDDTLYRRYRVMLDSGRAGKSGGAADGRPSSTSIGSPRGLGGSSSLLTSGFADVAAYAETHRQPDFIPIILVPAAITAPLQLLNIQAFLEQGDYIDPTTLYVNEETGESNVMETKPESVLVTPGSFLDRDKYQCAFRRFRVVDDPRQVQNWRHVCAAVVEGNEWQFRGWFPFEGDSARDPSCLFTRVRGFLPYFEEDKVPPQTQDWRVQPLLLTRRTIKSHQHLLEASRFWEQLFFFLDADEFFRLYTVPLDE